MRIKKYKNNEYIQADGIWVRNLCKNAESIDINSLCKDEMGLFLNNEQENSKLSSLHLDDLYEVKMHNAIIFSDGYNWDSRQKILASISNKIVKTIGVNGSLARWSMVGQESELQRTMSFYLANNPYRECMGYLPRRHRYYPNIVASIKTHPEFLKKYDSQPFFYMASKEFNYSGFENDSEFIRLDDYRNPICGAISLAWKLGVKRLALLCCDEAFVDERPNSIKMPNGLYQYPQQILCQKIIDKQLYWLKMAGVEIADCSSGIEYENAEYIDLEQLPSFFSKELQ